MKSLRLLACLFAAVISLEGCAGTVEHWIVNTRVNQGDVALQNGSLHEADTAYRLALRVNPKDARARTGFAQTSAPEATPYPTPSIAPGTDPAVATRAWLDTVPAEKRERSDAYFEGGYWLILWNFLLSVAISLFLLASRTSARLRDWAERRGKNHLEARQLSRRGGALRCVLNGDRVTIAGRAVLYLEGTITL